MELDNSKLKKIKGYFKKNKSVIALYLYGSYAKKTAKPNSDIDLGIIFDSDYRNKLNGFDSFGYQANVSKDLGIDVELQDLRSCTLSFAHRVLVEGQLIVANNEKERILFEEEILRKYFDSKPLFDEYYSSLSKITKKGEIHVRYV
ncbi:MAG: polymerase beta domain protein region protein [Candidatus Woesebacteria bacterium GW2011_GWA1_37_7]|uniref:Polymerase beta domain protein region protein n=1 Tax=Candidatus Woesebacteria bacterium GW2011_GWA1_37_7 TaxID=1618545 RepID=A0A0G0K515_9BACT|nr:MAG: polymerase beta domain protein region protein [Candidatus Woesebacteria bacterium GW2011_GWA1_37_7]